MNQKQLERMAGGQGFIAALDQSGGSSPRALERYGITSDAWKTDGEMYDLMHEMRTRMMKSPSFDNRILGAILFENTMDRQVDGKDTADFLWEEKGVIPFLKVDKGLEPEKDGVQLMKPIPNLARTLEKAKGRHIFGTKMRSVIHAANPKGIEEIVRQQFEIGKQIADAGLVPILEPEVDITIADKAEAEDILLKDIQEELAGLPADTKIMLKLSIPTKPGLYTELMKDPHIVRIVALSGGYSRKEANELLKKNPGLIASFSRALSEGLNANQTEEAFDKMMDDSIQSIYEASIA
ncbi:fructose bisphosphate aldolase [Faecalibaculum rodentium]|uniref:fructose bisphosphate aldolase n=1 Tax=Faecalibaculum rodentium TaxID=1702221 RepID=UPI0023F30181|nr:fructose bisphosphate aldolase [Faecalibaculum rodentium]